jgi:hypothetical protein
MKTTEEITVEFIKPNGQVFSIARNAEDAFYMWNTAKKLGHTVRINNINYGNGWESRYAIEQLFGKSYSILQG